MNILELYQPQSIALGVTIAIGLLLVLVLVRLARQLHLTRRALEELNDNLQTQVQERTLALSRANLRLQDEIIERQRAEQNLAAEHTLLRTVIDTLPDYIFVKDKAHRYLLNNIAHLHSLGLAAQSDTLGKTTSDFFRRAVAEASDAEDEAILQSGQPVLQEEEHIVHEIGDEGKWYISSRVPLRDGEGNAWGVVRVARDMTELKQGEAALNESEEKYRFLFSNSPDAFLILVGGVFADCNPAAERMLGGGRTRILGQALQALSPEFQPDGRKSSEAADEAIQQSLKAGHQTFEWVYRRFDGSEVTVEVSTASIRLERKPALFMVWRDVTERKRLEEELQELATTDFLTGIANRRHFVELFDREIRRARRFNHPLALALIDLDNFKSINDSLGHPAGDQVLMAFTQMCKNKIREYDILARLGGDEFILLLPETNSEQATEVLERVRHTVTSQPILFDGSRISLTVSSGISCLIPEEDSWERLLERADHALYRAKETGRNLVVVGCAP